ncbi:eclosion hormone-like [Toxorhynchites rutilus septentrionalis]|uniref:eclosion hormone-like n=1 Tax=Toxorhynchites rutilus septentrionalis TaxID=329112 RepID=UPI0024787DAF|nr:eclosion hormone-like [Toxorhynchites rutilus septentrionalis]
MNNIKFVLGALLLFVAISDLSVRAAPQFDLMGGYDFLGVCINNCAQCKKMYGAYFEGQLCADACIKFRGRVIPDCEDVRSIAPFLNKMDLH